MHPAPSARRRAPRVFIGAWMLSKIQSVQKDSTETRPAATTPPAFRQALDGAGLMSGAGARGQRLRLGHPRQRRVAAQRNALVPVGCVLDLVGRPVFVVELERR